MTPKVRQARGDKALETIREELQHLGVFGLQDALAMVETLAERKADEWKERTDNGELLDGFFQPYSLTPGEEPLSAALIYKISSAMARLAGKARQT